MDKLDLNAGRLIRETIQAHQHNVSESHWAELSPGQQESWAKVAAQYFARLNPQAGTGAPGVREWVLSPGGMGESPITADGPDLKRGESVTVREVAPDKQAQKEGA